MDITKFANTIDNLKERIEKHRPLYTQNETRTRCGLIDPILGDLGWRVGDPLRVHPEFAVGRNRADYALLDDEQNPVAVIEAKKLGEPFEEDHITQMLSYAMRANIGYAGITDGDRWRLYSIFERRDSFADKCRLDVTIIGMPTHECVLKLLTLWLPNLSSGHPVAAPRQFFQTETVEPTAPFTQVQTQAQAPSKDAVQTQTQTQTQAPAPREGEWMVLPEYIEAFARMDRPTALKFPDDSEVAIKKWADMMHRVGVWLHTQGHLSAEQMPILTTSGRAYIANSTPTRPGGEDMWVSEQIGTGVYVEGDSWRTRILHFLKVCGVNSAQVRVKVKAKAG